MSNKHPNMWDYLESLGILESGSDADIKQAKRDYKKIYIKRYRRERRADKPEYSVGFSRKSGELGKVSLGAQRHRMTITRFIREATLAYLDRRFLTLYPHRIVKLEQLLMDCLNEIKAISQVKDRSNYDQEQKYEAIATRIGKMEEQMRDLFHYPQLLDEAISNATTADPIYREKLLSVLTHDNQNQIA